MDGNEHSQASEQAAPASQEPIKTNPATVKDLEFDGYKFTVDTDLLDDVEALEIIDRIENKGQVAGIIPLLHFLIGKDGYEKMKAHFVETEGRFRLTRLSKIYELIINNFDPKG